MKSLFEFNVYKESSTVEVKKEFDVSLELLWNACTNS